MWQRLRAIVRKELIQTARDRRTLVAMLMPPVVLLFLFGYAVEMQVDHIPTVVVDGSRDSQSWALLEALETSGFFDIDYYVESEAEAIKAIDEGQARADERAAQAALKHLQDMEQNPLFYTAKAHAAEGEYRVADAGLKVVQAELRDLVAGSKASVALAEAQLRLAEMMQQRLTLRSPLAGTVVARMANVGETALPSVTLLTVADLSELYLAVYVPQTRLGDVFLEQAVHASVDAFPQRRFEGQVLHIAPRPVADSRTSDSIPSWRRTSAMYCAAGSSFPGGFVVSRRIKSRKNSVAMSVVVVISLLS